MANLRNPCVGAIVVTFNPDDRLREVLTSICSQVSNVVVVDNGSSNIQFIRDLSELNSNINLIELQENFGIGEALNVGVSKVSGLGLKWILTLDQDSITHPDMVKELFSCAIEFEYDSVCPIAVENLAKESISIGHESVDLCITSGQMTKIEVINSINGFDSELFIDNVDFDFCLKLKNHNFSLGRVYSAILFHQLGEVTVKKRCCHTFHTFHTFHSPLRRYYMYRNSVYLIRQYFRSNPIIICKFIVASFLSFFSIIAFGERRACSLKMISLGLFHAFIGRKGGV